jgi:alkanesulfonate monooxygenase SsuD/methylene tetrahydromethanopterin reductase-like flavin-dependent oxidoreductase (luciferase family)
VSPEAFGQQVQMLRDQLRAHGRAEQVFTFSVHCPVFAWPEADAWQRVRESYHYVEWKYQDMVAEPYATRRTASVPPELTATVEDHLRPSAIVGTPAQVAERIQAFRDAAGEPLHFISRLYWPGMSSTLQREALAVFAEEVIPMLRPARAPSQPGSDRDGR